MSDLRMTPHSPPIDDASMVLTARRNTDGGVTDFEIRDANELALMLHGGPSVLGTTVRGLFPRQQAEELIETCEHVCVSRRPLRASDFACAPEPVGRAAPSWDVRVVPIDDGVVFHWRASTHTDPRTFVLAETERRYRLLAENASDVVCLIDGDDKVVWVSPSVERSLGYRVADLIGTDIGPVIEPIDLERVLATRMRVFAGSSETLELRVKDATGATVWVSCRAHPLIEAGRLVGAVLGIRDIGEEVAVRAELQRSEQRYREAAEQYRLLIENSSDVVMRSKDGRISWVSSAVTPMLGYRPDDLVGRSTADLVHPDDLETTLRARADATSGDEADARVRARTATGDYRWIDVRSRPYVASDGMVDGLVSTIRLIDAEMAAQRVLEHDATHDPLTGLVNRTEALHQLEVLRMRSPRTGTRAAVLYLDIDRFKDVNDLYGHAAGDQVLTEIARRLEDIARSADIVARIGGDELLIILNGVHDEQDALATAERLRDACSPPIVLETGTDLRVTLSIGLAVAEEGELVAHLVGRADTALYAAKQAGRDRVVVAT